MGDFSLPAGFDSRGMVVTSTHVLILGSDLTGEKLQVLARDSGQASTVDYPLGILSNTAWLYPGLDNDAWLVKAPGVVHLTVSPSGTIAFSRFGPMDNYDIVFAESADRSVWVANSSNLLHLSPTGDVLASVPGFGYEHSLTVLPNGRVLATGCFATSDPYANPYCDSMKTFDPVSQAIWSGANDIEPADGVVIVAGKLWLHRESSGLAIADPAALGTPGLEVVVPTNWHADVPVVAHDGALWAAGQSGYDYWTATKYPNYHADLYRMSPRAQVRLGVTDNVQRYVMRVYDNLFTRLPDPSGLSGWTAAIGAGTPRGAVSNAITSSVEFRSGLIAGAYQRYLDRNPDPAGLQGWLNAMSVGMTIEQLDANFIGSAEYYARAGGTPEGWVRDLYADVLRRNPDPVGLAHWVLVLGQGASRAQVSMGFVMSTEYLSSVVDGYYTQLLNRPSDPAGRASWVSLIQQGARDEQIIAGIIGSNEYFTTS